VLRFDAHTLPFAIFAPMQPFLQSDTICALSTANGVGAIAVIRLSGPSTFEVLAQLFSKDLSAAASHTMHFGTIKVNGKLLDEVVVGIFRNPNSFTGEDVAEISCHGSPYIQQTLLQGCLALGCRMAEPGEFTQRAFFNRKMDLSQAEAVADLIASESAAAHQLAMHQMRGGFSNQINALRSRLVDFASLIELELDFSEEDVEFADRDDLKNLVKEIQQMLSELISSFALGNVLKNGVPVAIMGVPNVGKSTLLNALLNEERAIVSDIPGTTRDTVEDELMIEGTIFRFIDTAGLRETTDHIETIGISRSYAKANDAAIILYLVDATEANATEVETTVASFRDKLDSRHQQLLVLLNKMDLQPSADLRDRFSSLPNAILISAKQGDGLEDLKTALSNYVSEGKANTGNTVVTNTRHHQALLKANAAMDAVMAGLVTGITGDFLAIDIRQGLHHLGEITGEITTDDLLGNIFGKFCIGK